jgi:DnaJ-class molecular chaperone
MTDTQEVWLKVKCPTCEGAQELDEHPCDRCGGTGKINGWFDFNEWKHE